MGINNKISAGYAYYLTLTIEEWIDVFSRPVYKHIIVDSLNYCVANKGLEVYCWCLMSNHLHLVACASEYGNLSNILRDFKKFTSKAIIEAIKEIPESRRDWMLNLFWYAGKNNKKIKYFKVWQEGNDTQEIHTTAFLEEKMNYIHNNPVKAELVANPARPDMPLFLRICLKAGSRRCQFAIGTFLLGICNPGKECLNYDFGD